MSVSASACAGSAPKAAAASAAPRATRRDVPAGVITSPVGDSASSDAGSREPRSAIAPTCYQAVANWLSRCGDLRERRAEILRQRRLLLHARARARVRERQPPRVQELPGEPELPRRAVLRIARHGMPDREQVRADLVGPA